MMFSLDGNKDGAKYKNLMNWSCAIGYGVGSGSPLSPSFNFGLELAKSSQVFSQIVQIIFEFAPKSLALSILNNCFISIATRFNILAINERVEAFT